MLLVFLIFSLIALWLTLALLAEQLRRRRLKACLPAHTGYNGESCHPVIVYTSEDLGSGRSLGRSGRLGIMLVDQQGVRMVCSGQPGHKQTSETIFEAALVEMAWIPASALTLGIPSLVRLSGNSGFFYFAARNRFGSPAQRGTLDLQRLLAMRFSCKRVAAQPEHLLGLGLKVALILALVTSLGAAFYAHLGTDLPGPQIIAAGFGQVAVGNNRELILMGTDGAVKQRWPLSRLGISGQLTELHWAGQNILYLGDVGAGSIQRCEIDPLDCRALPGLENNGLDLLGAFSFAIDNPEERIYLADSGNHRVLVLDLEGNLITEFDGLDRKFCFPNTLRIAPDNAFVYLSDTNNFRQVAFLMNDGRAESIPQMKHQFFVKTLPEDYGCRHDGTPKFHEKWLDRAADFYLRGRPTAIPGFRSDRVWGFDSLRDNLDRWWVILGDGNLRRGDLARFSSDWGDVDRIELPVGSDPASMAMLDDDLLVADPLRPAIYLVDTASLQVTEFGSPAWRAELQTLAIGWETTRLFYHASLGLALFFLCAVLLMAVRYRRHVLGAILSAEQH